MLSVVIPTYNKKDVLEETLKALEGQVLEGADYEVIVVDDGSTDGTLEWLGEQQFKFTCRVLSQANRGAGAARNLGARAAQGEVLLFLDADILAASGLLGVHWAAHQREGHILVAGRVPQWTALKGGAAYQVFARMYDLGEEARKLAYPFVLTQNLSIRAKDFALLGSFDEDLLWGEDTEFAYRASEARFEFVDDSRNVLSELGGFDENLPRGQDTEFGYRASRAGFEILYNPRAVGYHNHVLSLAQICEKTRKDHKQLVLLFRKYPEILKSLDYLQDKLPIDWKQDSYKLILRKGLRDLLAFPIIREALQWSCVIIERYWPDSGLVKYLAWKVIGGYQWIGLREGMRQYGWQP